MSSNSRASINLALSTAEEYDGNTCDTITIYIEDLSPLINLFTLHSSVGRRCSAYLDS
jgi:hypothetical protein